MTAQEPVSGGTGDEEATPFRLMAQYAIAKGDVPGMDTVMQELALRHAYETARARLQQAALTEGVWLRGPFVVSVHVESAVEKQVDQ